MIVKKKFFTFYTHTLLSNGLFCDVGGKDRVQPWMTDLVLYPNLFHIVAAPPTAAFYFTTLNHFAS